MVIHAIEYGHYCLNSTRIKHNSDKMSHFVDNLLKHIVKKFILNNKED